MTKFRIAMEAAAVLARSVIGAGYAGIGAYIAGGISGHMSATLSAGGALGCCVGVTLFSTWWVSSWEKACGRLDSTVAAAIWGFALVGGGILGGALAFGPLGPVGAIAVGAAISVVGFPTSRRVLAYCRRRRA